MDVRGRGWKSGGHLINIIILNLFFIIIHKS